MSPIAVRRVTDYTELSHAAAAEIADVIRTMPPARILLATGETPMGAYREVAAMAGAGRVDTSRVTVFQLDEYVGIGPEDRRSLGRWALDAFVRPLGIEEERFVRVPVDDRVDLEAYDRRIRDGGGYDLAILGIGENGHLGFNEPPTDAGAPSRIVRLSEASRIANARYWGGDGVPERAVTIGLGPILETPRILLLASGERKRAILRRALADTPTPDVPASFLQRARSVMVITDRAAAPDLPEEPHR